MKIVDINNQINVNYILFNDNQPHVTVNPDIAGENVRVICRMKSSLDVMHLLQVSDALDRLGCHKIELCIPYFMGARYDRVMVEGDSLDVVVFARLINTLNFSLVTLFDPHSDVTTAVINNCMIVDNELLVKSYNKENPVLIIPDAGAAKKVGKYIKWLIEANGSNYLVDVVHCIKDRNVTTGDLKIKVLEPERCKDRNVVIIDDICDGGRTFIEIGRQVDAAHSTLIVTHGIFSQGLSPLVKYFDQIIVSDTYHDWTQDGKGDPELIKCIKYSY